MNTLTARLLSVAILPLFLASCASGPRVSEEAVSQPSADAWFRKYCSDNGTKTVNGELVIKSNTQEFKGQFPASVAFNPDGSFNLEVTNILGGTVAQLKGDPKAMQIRVPGKPKLSRNGVTHYLGLETAVLIPLLRGELPCPAEARSRDVKVEVEGNAMKVRSANWDWYFYRTTPEQGEVPARVELRSGGHQIEMTVEDWHAEERYLRKASIKSLEGDLKWTWRDRKAK